MGIDPAGLTPLTFWNKLITSKGGAGELDSHAQHEVDSKHAHITMSGEIELAQRVTQGLAKIRELYEKSVKFRAFLTLVTDKFGFDLHAQALRQIERDAEIAGTRKILEARYRADEEAALIERQEQLALESNSLAVRLVFSERRKMENHQRVMIEAAHAYQDATSNQVPAQNLEPAETISEDILDEILDKTARISDADAARLWGRILAREIQSPGRYHRRTLRILADLEPEHLQQLQAIIRLSIIGTDGAYLPLIYDLKDSMIIEYGLHFHLLENLDAIGLIRFTAPGQYSSTVPLPDNQDRIYMDFNGTWIYILRKDESGFLTVPVGHVRLTDVGQQLATLAEVETDNRLLEYAVRHLRQHGFTVIT